MKETIRVRFAPSPTGFMHLGNIRAALMNYLFAQKHNGTFVLRIEDTDQKRNLEEARLKIMHDLAWLGLTCNEGPDVGGDYGPYLQSQRAGVYQEKLQELISMGSVYRCFCTHEELEQKRKEQIAAKLPPRYDRTCLNYSQEQIEDLLKQNKKFIWRLKLDEHKIIEIKDCARETITFDMHNFSDPALTRQDGTCTFIFANFVDDVLMKITHVIRGEDHISNTAIQAALYDAFDFKIPVFWHLPIICNTQGQKLSKRDFGFTLNDLKEAGFTHEAIANYLAIIGASFENEIQSLDEILKSFDFDHVRASGTIKYDFEKLTWINHQWLQKISLEDLVNRAKLFVYDAFEQSKDMPEEKLTELIRIVQPELKTLCDTKELLEFYFNEPIFDRNLFTQTLSAEKETLVFDTIKTCLSFFDNPELFFKELKSQAKNNGLSIKDIFSSLRYILTGSFNGIGMKDLLSVLEQDKIKTRIEKILG